MPASDEETRDFHDAPTSDSGTGAARSRDPALDALEQRYDLLGEVGRGGMGIVYRACDRETGEIVALKILQPEIAGRTEIVEHFKSELVLARKVTHKNACRIHELLRFGNTVTISMEFVEGESLRTFLRKYGAVPLRRGLQWAQQICSVLAEAHSQGVVHRDLKPENMVIDRQGQIKVMDFGIARSLETDSTQTGALIGTPGYMSPEQAEGKQGDARSDIYSFGVVLYEMFTGRRAFQGDTPMAVALKQIHETPPPPCVAEPYLPVFLDGVIRKCLQKKPGERFQAVAEVDAALRNEPVSPGIEAAGPETPFPAHLARWQRSDFVLLAAAIASCVAFLLLFDRVFPYSAVKFLDKDRAEAAVQNGLAKLDLEITSQKGKWSLGVQKYPYLAAMLGPRTARRLLEAGEASRWEFELRGAELVGTWFVDQAGRSTEVSITNVRPKFLPKEVSVEEGQALAARTIQLLFGEDVTVARPSRAEKDLDGSFRYAYDVARSSLAFVERIYLSAGDFYFRASTSHWEWTPPETLRRQLVPGGTGVVIATLAPVVLFFLRSLHRRETSRVAWRMAAGASALATIVSALTLASFSIGGMLRLIAAALVFFGLFYTAAAVVEYYMKASDRSRLLNMERFTCVANNPPTGLAMMRGALLGLMAAGSFVILLAMSGETKWILPETRWLHLMLTTLHERNGLISLRAPAGFVGDCLMVWLLVALPSTLIWRVTPRPLLVISGATIAWLASGFSLDAMSVYPAGAHIVVIALQGLAVSLIYWRWDLLTAMASIFAAEAWLNGYAIWKVFQPLGFLYVLPLALWFALILAAFAIYFRSDLAEIRRRAATVFE